MYNLYQTNDKITLDSILDYLSVRPEYESIFKVNNGPLYVTKASENATLETFDYYYNRVKKFTLLRECEKIGISLKKYYDPTNILDVKKKQKQEEWLDTVSLSGIVELINDTVDTITTKYVEDVATHCYQAGENMSGLIDKYRQEPDYGAPMYGTFMNTITKGARPCKLYLRSGATGTGKTRSLIADACNFACDKIYSDHWEDWISNGTSLPTLYISTEQDQEEIQTMMLAFLSNVDEDHIISGKYLDGEYERVQEAAKIFAKSPLWVEELPDFSLKDIEVKIKKHIKEHNVQYVCHDYIHTSTKIIKEIVGQSGGVKLREDNILFMLSTKLKDICNKYGVFIISATQLNGDYKTSTTPDQNLLRGAKAIADKIDIGMILLPTTPEDLEKIAPIVDSNINFRPPNMKISIYKNRRSKIKGVYLWCNSNLGTCRTDGMFFTTYNHEFIPIEDIKIILREKGE